MSASFHFHRLSTHLSQLLNVLHEFKTGVRRTVKFEETRYRATYESLLKNAKRLERSARHKLGFLTLWEQLFTQGQ